MINFKLPIKGILDDTYRTTRHLVYQETEMDEDEVDRIFTGELHNLPKLSTKLVRIFTSSTFTDMLMERNTLMQFVYPRLKAYCREKHGIEFQVKAAFLSSGTGASIGRFVCHLTRTSPLT